MKFDLKPPCSKCPFRTDVGPYLRAARAAEIVVALGRGSFACHETAQIDIDGEDTHVTQETQHCAGALIMLEHADRPSQIMRVAERLGLYDRRAMDMDAPVYQSPQAWVVAHAEKEHHDDTP